MNLNLKMTDNYNNNTYVLLCYVNLGYKNKVDLTNNLIKAKNDINNNINNSRLRC